MAHQKHPPIKRPTLGYYGRNEFALLGTTCERLDGLLATLLKDLSAVAKILTVTGDHGENTEGGRRQYAEKVLRDSTSWNEYDDRLLGSNYDLVLVNGNHDPAAKQIIFLNPKKAGTLERRRAQLTDVVAIVAEDGVTELPDWMIEDHPDLPPVWTKDIYTKLYQLLATSAHGNVPEVKALILTGGKSTRMGADKASLVYRDGVGEAERLATICREKGLDTYYSVSDASTDDNEIPDRFLGLGPLGAIASAFLFDPDASWLVLACDLPLIDENVIQGLLDSREPRSLATAVRGVSKPFPEPLIAIYEPRAYARLLHFLSIGYACPRKVLINSDVAELVLRDETPLTNANTPEERAAVLNKL